VKRKSRKRFLLIFLASLPVLGIVGYFAAKKVAWPIYKEWREKRFNQLARQFFEAEDFENAMLTTRKNLRYNQNNLDAWRLGVEISEKQNRPDAVFYQKRLAELEPTLSNQLKLIRLATRFRQYREADLAISRVVPEAANSAEFHELAAQASLRMGNAVQARYHLMSLVALSPDDRKARLDLAQLRLNDAAPDLRPSIRAEIRAIADDPAHRHRALGLLVRDSVRHGEAAEALELANLLRADPGLPLAASAVVADALLRFDEANFGPYVDGLQLRAGTDPLQVGIVAEFLVALGETARVRNWIESLPVEVTRDERIQLQYAAALAKEESWQKLEEYLRPARWATRDYFRQAILAFAQRNLGKQREFEETWRSTLVAVGNNPEDLATLLAQVTVWNWNSERIEVLWRIFQINPRDERTQQQLIAHERAAGNTPNLNRLFSRLIESNPADAAAKNNLAYTSLLLNTNLTRAHALAREAHQAEPHNPYFLTTYAFSLLRQGKPAEGLALIDRLDPVQLTQPERIILRSALLQAAGQPEEAAIMLNTVTGAGMLPEERRLLAETRAAVNRDLAARQRTTRLTAVAAQVPPVDAERSWLRTLPVSLVGQPTIEMELADSLYAREDFAGLVNELRTERWGTVDYLRLALLAYAQRRTGDVSASRNTWRAAVGGVGTRVDQMRLLADQAARWSWDDERIELLGRILQREPENRGILEELALHHHRRGNVPELARIYGFAAQATPGDPTLRARFAFYNLLGNTRLSESQVAAKAAYDINPADPFTARTYAFALWRNRQFALGLQTLRPFATTISSDADPTLYLALLTFDAGQPEESRRLLNSFNRDSALPEERSLAEELDRRLLAARF
jgi:Flp pilus assembly protein TadD